MRGPLQRISYRRYVQRIEHTHTHTHKPKKNRRSRSGKGGDGTQRVRAEVSEQSASVRAVQDEVRKCQGFSRYETSRDQTGQVRILDSQTFRGIG